jgi:preprotein translocase subunit SecA
MELADKTAADKEPRVLKKFEEAGTPNPTVMRQVEKSILLQSIDGLWREHLVTLDHLSKVVGWRGLAQRDPLNEYKQEAFELFQAMLANLRELVTTQLSHIEIQTRPPSPPPPPRDLSESHIDPLTGDNDARGESLASVLGATTGAGAALAQAANSEELRPIDPKLLVGVPRNAPCPCGSGKKVKHCHGAFV